LSADLVALRNLDKRSWGEVLALSLMTAFQIIGVKSKLMHQWIRFHSSKKFYFLIQALVVLLQGEPRFAKCSAL
jgi:hypothetical protein